MKNWHDEVREYENEGREFEGHKTNSKPRRRKTAAQIRKENKAAFEQARTVEVSCVPTNWRNPENPFMQKHIANQSAFAGSGLK